MPIRRFLLVLGAVLSGTLWTPTPVSAQPEVQPVFYRGNYIARFDVAYGDHERQILDLHLRGAWGTPEGTMNRRMEGPQPPTVVFLHGSAWYVSDKREWEHFISPFLQQGYNVVNVNYRLREGIAPALDDVRQALAYLAENNDDLGLDLDNVFLAGASAGGFMATYMGAVQNAEDPALRPPADVRIKGVINIVGGGTDCYRLYTDLRDHENEFWRNVARSLAPDPSQAEAAMDAVCPDQHIDAGDPPILLAHGGLDEFGTPDTYLALEALLNQHQVPVERVEYPRSGHTFIQEDFADTFVRAIAFIERYAD